MPEPAAGFQLELVGNPWQCDLHYITIKSLCQESLQLNQGFSFLFGQTGETRERGGGERVEATEK